MHYFFFFSFVYDFIAIPILLPTSTSSPTFIFIMDLFATADVAVVCDQREHYDADGMAHPANDSYFPANLLKREALRFDPNVQFLLRTIWRWDD